MATVDKPQTSHLLIGGVFMILFGVIAIATPALAGTAVVLVIGGLLFIAGIVEMVQAFRADTWGSMLLTFGLGLLTLICGIGVLAHPLLGLKFLTLLLAIYFIVEGIWKIIGSFGLRSVSGWPLMTLSGIVSLLLGIIIYRQWPVSGLWAVGLLVGIDFLMTGASMIALAITVRRFNRMTPTSGAHPA